MNFIKRNFIVLLRLGLISGLGFCFSLANAEQLNKEDPYQRLKKSLPLYEAAVKHPWPKLDFHESLHFGMRDPAVLILRQRLCATEDLTSESCYLHSNDSQFDKELEDAVVLFQERHGLISDGIIDEATRQALNISPWQRLQQIKLNLQRWSRLMARVEPVYIWINIPDHRLRFIKNHRPILISRIIVGKPSRKTPEINSKVTRIILNPYWTVPPGIARRDVIPQIIKNKEYLQQHRMKVYAANRPNKALNSDQVDWLAAQKNPSRIILRQDPGPHNALGQIKFEFSNPYLVYLHDTPGKHLFDAKRRLFSSGCVRMEDPFELLEALTQIDPALKQTEAQIESTLESGKTVAIRLTKPIPIHLTYITAWVDKTDVLHFWDDVYGQDAILLDKTSGNENDFPESV